MTPNQFVPKYIVIRRLDDIFIVSFKMTHLTEEENIEELGFELFSLVEQYDCRKLIISHADVKLITSSVLGKLITLHRRIHRKEGILILCDMTGDVAEVMKTSKLIEYFNVAVNVEAALGILGGN